MASWNPGQYMRFGSDRLRPALDLMAQILLETPSSVIDLGCGPGNVTDLLAKRWPGAKISGLDGSVDMLKQAQDSYANISWQVGDVETWVPDQPVDLIFSNACLHWLDNHDVLFPRLFDQLNPGGVMAIQMPNNFSSPTHQLIRDCLDPIGRSDLAPNFPVQTSEFYYDILGSGCVSLNIWETRYLHVLEGENPVFNWTKGAALRPVLEDLTSEQDREKFLRDYAAAIELAYEKRADGKTLMPFNRFFLTAVKK